MPNLLCFSDIQTYFMSKYINKIIQIYVIHLYETHYNVNNRLESLSVQLFIVIIVIKEIGLNVYQELLSNKLRKINKLLYFFTPIEVAAVNASGWLRFLL